jgi:hypothetical protein
VRHLRVLDREGALVGIVTDRAVRHRLFASDVYRIVASVYGCGAEVPCVAVSPHP